MFSSPSFDILSKKEVYDQRMFILYIYNIFISIILINSSTIPFISNVTLKGGYDSNSTIIINKTCDECGRFWVTLEVSTVLIYDQLGNFLANFTLPNTQIFDIKFMNNYLMYLSDWNTNRIYRLEPNIQC